MDHWISIAQWVAAAAGVLLAVSAVALGAMAWMLNHPD
jgi:hypothetical protein